MCINVVTPSSLLRPPCWVPNYIYRVIFANVFWISNTATLFNKAIIYLFPVPTKATESCGWVVLIISLIKSFMLLIWDTRKKELYGDQDGVTSGYSYSCPLTGDLTSYTCACRVCGQWGKCYGSNILCHQLQYEHSQQAYFLAFIVSMIPSCIH